MQHKISMYCNFLVVNMKVLYHPSVMPDTPDAPLLVCLGRVAIDLYGEERGAALPESRRFVRYLGGTSGNLAVGAARLGLRVELVGAVGADPMGEFLRRTLIAEHVGVAALASLARRRTALAFLGMLGAEAIALDFYRETAADSEVSATPECLAVVGKARALALCGTHLADPAVAQRIAPIIVAARAAGAQIVLDLDLRPALWRAMPGGTEATAARVAKAACDMDLVVGNEEEFALVAGVVSPFDEPSKLRQAFKGGIGIEARALRSRLARRARSLDRRAGSSCHGAESRRRGRCVPRRVLVDLFDGRSARFGSGPWKRLRRPSRGAARLLRCNAFRRRTCAVSRSASGSGSTDLAFSPNRKTP